MRIRIRPRARPLHERQALVLLRKMRRHKILTQDQWKLLNQFIEDGIIVFKPSPYGLFVAVEGMNNIRGGEWFKEKKPVLA